MPFAVSVITSEFMRDFDFFDIAGDVGYVANLNGLDTQGNSNLRGYGATFYLRNGFYRLERASGAFSRSSGSDGISPSSASHLEN